MRGLKRFARYVVPGVLAACVMSLGSPCAAQEPDPPTPPDVADGRGSVFAPSAWLVVNTPLRKEIALKSYGFYIGELNVPVAQFDLPIRTTKFLTITPSYMYYSVPPSGLNKLPPQPAGFTDSYDEHQFRVDGTVAFAVRKLEISGRNMYVRRFRATPSDDINRYRGRLAIAYPVAVHGRIWKPFASYEAYYDRGRRLEPRSRLVRRHAARHQAGVRSAVLPVGNQRREQRRSLPVVRAHRQHAIARPIIVTNREGDHSC